MAIIETYINPEVVDTGGDRQICRHFGGLDVDVDVGVGVVRVVFGARYRLALCIYEMLSSQGRALLDSRLQAIRTCVVWCVVDLKPNR
jgi:hypothetical protein